MTQIVTVAIIQCTCSDSSDNNSNTKSNSKKKNGIAGIFWGAKIFVSSEFLTS